MSDQEDYDEIGADQVLTAAEGVEIRQRIAARMGPQQWHWMGNYGNVYDPVTVARSYGAAAGEMILNFNFNNGLIATWMFF
jgi:hypothetical protein